MAAPPNIHPITPYALAKVSITNALANTLRDGTGTIPTVFTAGTAGAVVADVRAVTGVAVTVVSTAMCLRLWHRIAGAGSWFLIDEVAYPTTTPSGTAAATQAVFNRTNIPLGPGDLLGVTQSIAESVYYTSNGGNF